MSICADVDGNDEIKRDKMTLEGELKYFMSIKRYANQKYKISNGT